eukprot:gb/GFBE01008234.1/.p1 GENE.gb/GFBE01008234.1/~~gb/GFBE01008234.1/.p1  ORF type:complete len:448 (+),score=133.01 gb/GFBE01008234.1/:1-1344(+)
MRSPRSGAAIAAILVVACLDSVIAGGSDSRSATTVTAKTWENFMKEQREKQRPVLVIFHVAWCKACQRIFPLFAAASDEAKEKDVPMDFAHVECTDDKTLCQKFEVQGYPTIKLFFPESEKPPQNFKGQRTTAGFVKYAQRMTSPPIRSFADYGELEKALQDEQFASFITTDRHSKGLKPVAERWMDRHVIASAPQIADLLPKDVSVPEGAALAVLSMAGQQWAGNSQATPAVSFYDGRFDDEQALEAWIKANRFPGVWAMGESNFHEFTHADRPAAIVAMGKEVSPEVEEQIRGAQKSLSSHYFFGVVDGAHWTEELKHFNILPKELPRVFVTENNFESWVEDINELRVESLTKDLTALAEGAPLLRQGRTFFSKVFYAKREAWRFVLRMQVYAQKGPVEAATVFAGAAAFLVLVLAFLWIFFSCCRVMLQDDEDQLRQELQRKTK